jgi:hypothetical protein
MKVAWARPGARGVEGKGTATQVIAFAKDGKASVIIGRALLTAMVA